MKQTTMCILSVFFGALFAVACGVVDGVGDKVANANETSVGLTKEVYEYDCPDGTQNSCEFDYGAAVNLNGNALYSYHYECSNGEKMLFCDGNGYSKVIYVTIK
jgi:hypothetical protein